MKLVGVVLLALAVWAKEEAAPAPKLWALLVAGSNGYFNYRHQADVCHAYQVLHNHGIPDENIVVMMFDDIANSKENPVPGTIINHPLGHDVYNGVPKDYTGKDVTPENFIKILEGDANAMKGIGSGKVIASGPNDHVFVNFVDHGAPGLVAFPSSELTAHELVKTLEDMHTANRYKQMLVYVEACESGSMFQGLLKNDLNIYATTAANASESSYACYYDKKRETYLGDVYSVKWMEDSDKENLRTESILKQFKMVKKETNTSHVQEFGDLRMAREPVAVFQGEKTTDPIRLHKVPYSTAASRDAPLDILYKRHSFARSHVDRQRIFVQISELNHKREFLEKVISSLALGVAQGETLAAKQAAADVIMTRGDTTITDWTRYNELVHFFSRTCFNLGENPYALKYVYVLVNLANSNIPLNVLKAEMRSFCSVLEPVHGGVH